MTDLHASERLLRGPADLLFGDMIAKAQIHFADNFIGRVRRIRSLHTHSDCPSRSKLGGNKRGGIFGNGHRNFFRAVLDKRTLAKAGQGSIPPRGGAS